MSSFTFHRLKAALAEGSFSWEDDDLRVLLLRTAGGFSEDPSIDTIDAIDGEMIATGYAREAVTGRAVTRDDLANLSRWTADDVTFPALGPGPNIEGAILYVHETDDSDSWPAIYFAEVAGSITGTDYVLTFDSDGVLIIRDA